MKNIKKIFVICIIAVFFAAGCKKDGGKEVLSASAAEETGNTETEKQAEQKEITEDEIGYAFGVIIAETVKEGGITLNPKEIVKGFNAANSNNFDKKGLADAQMLLNQAFYQAQLKRITKNLEDGTKFLEENAKRSEVKVTESGLQYEILQEGTDSRHPEAQDAVLVHYKGSLLDGTVFDDSSASENPVQIELSRVIPGWTEGVQLMTKGSKFKFFVPPALGYGEQGIVQNGKQIIPGNAVLIFEIELTEIIAANKNTSDKD